MQDLDSLLKRASSHYLQGDVEAALAAWKGALQLAPDDERALEGVRLCRHMLAARGEEISDEEGEAAVAAAAADGDAFPELDAKLDFGEPPPAAAGVDLAWSLSEDGDDEVDRPAAPDPAPEIGLAPPSTPGWGWDLGEGAEADPDAADDEPAEPAPPIPVAIPLATPKSTAATSELELRRRANELLANALVALEAGNDDEASRTLDRVLILDDSNEAARSLKEKIATQQRSRPSIVPSAPRTIELEPVDLDIGLAHAERPIPVLDLPDHEPLLEPDPAGSFDTPEELSAADTADAADVADVEAEEPARAAPAQPGRSIGIALSLPPGLRRWAVVVAAIVACAAVAYGWLGGTRDAPGPSAAKADVDAAALGRAKAAGAGRKPAADAGPAASGGSAAATFDPAAGLAEAEAAYAAGDYSQAILGYNAVLKAAPDNAAAREGLRKAGDSYREQRELLQQWEQAQQAFANGDYEEALRQFYRMEGGGDPALVTRYKTDGWYNLGVLALRAGDCKRARSNLDDARQVQGSDEGLLDAMQLARACGRDAQLRQKAAAMPLHTPES